MVEKQLSWEWAPKVEVLPKCYYWAWGALRLCCDLQERSVMFAVLVMEKLHAEVIGAMVTWEY